MLRAGKHPPRRLQLVYASQPLQPRSVEKLALAAFAGAILGDLYVAVERVGDEVDVGEAVRRRDGVDVVIRPLPRRRLCRHPRRRRRRLAPRASIRACRSHRSPLGFRVVPATPAQHAYDTGLAPGRRSLRHHGGMATMQELAETANAIAATSSKREKVRLLAAFLTRLSGEELAQATRYFAGLVFPVGDTRTLNVGGAAFSAVVRELPGIDDAEVGRIWRRHG